MKTLLRIIPFVLWGILSECFNIHLNDLLFWIVLGILSSTPILYAISEDL